MATSAETLFVSAKGHVLSDNTVRDTSSFAWLGQWTCAVNLTSALPGSMI